MIFLNMQQFAYSSSENYIDFEDNVCQRIFRISRIKFLRATTVRNAKSTISNFILLN